ncbi:MAG: hypothetical protein HQL44_01560 [Alphaproteobacteria bacterium]|nr:hypothetical protein [Alphaproteobacteria bacterium]
MTDKRPAILAVVLVALGVFLAVSAKQLAYRYEPDPVGGFTRDVPKNLDGMWGEKGDCTSKSARTLDFMDGGFRWKKGGVSGGRDNYGLVRGLYKYDLGASRVFFKLNETSEDTVSHTEPEYDITIAGDTMVRRHVYDGFSEVFQRCRNQEPKREVPKW